MTLRIPLVPPTFRTNARRVLVVIGVVVLSSCEPLTELPPIAVASCTVTPAAPSLAISDTLALSVTPLDGRGDPLRDVLVSWRSLSPLVSSVDADRGVLRGVGVGTTQVIATCGSRSTTVNVTVTPRPVVRLEMSAAAVALTELDTVRVSASAYDDRGVIAPSVRITWTSDDATVATVDTSGQIVGVSPGTVTIAARADAVTATTTVRVTPRVVASVSLSPNAFALPRYESQSMTVSVRDATGRQLTVRVPLWRSSAPSVASVSVTGVLTAHAVGTSTITATVDALSASASVTVIPPATVVRVELTPLASVLMVGQSRLLVATPRDSAGRALSSRVVSWSSSVPAIATVIDGTVTAVAPGTVTVTASVEGSSATATITVQPIPVASLSVSFTSSTVRTGQMVTAVAIVRDSAGNALQGRMVTWSSNNPAVASVSTNGAVAGIAEGNAVISATLEGRSAAATLTVTPPPVASLKIVPEFPSVPLGGMRTVQAIAYDSAGAVMPARVIRWSTNNATIATVNAQGAVTGVGLGNTTLYAETGGRTVSTTLTVRNIGTVSKVEVTPGMSTLLPGQSQQLSWRPLDNYGFEVPNRIVTFASSDLTVATISSTGLVQAMGLGATTITVRIDGKTALTRIVVIPTFGQPFATVATTPSAYSEQVCALMRDGRAYCMGTNWYAQLGNGSTRSSDTLVAVATPVRFSAVAVGEDHACALAFDGAAWCWGDNRHGQLGDGTVIGRLTPVAVSGGVRFTSLVAASDYSCGIAIDGAAWCWGTNAHQGLGVGNATASSRIPLAVVGGHRFLRLSVMSGGKAICGISISNALLCWGDRVPDGSSVSRATPVDVSDGRRFTHVVDGFYRACALDVSGTIWCTHATHNGWGWRRQLASYSELFGSGNGSTVCARLATGRVRCGFGSSADDEFVYPDMPSLLMLSVGRSTGAYGIDANGRLLQWPDGGPRPAYPGPRVLVVP